MSNAKIENLLNLALDANPAEREKSLNLGVGYSAKEQTWEVIVRFIRNGIGQVEKLYIIYRISIYVKYKNCFPFAYSAHPPEGLSYKAKKLYIRISRFYIVS